jgi:hypothetical protein
MCSGRRVAERSGWRPSVIEKTGSSACANFRTSADPDKCRSPQSPGRVSSIR